MVLGQTLESYDQDSYKTVDYLLSLPTCTGLIGATGMCLGGHLALRAAVSLLFIFVCPQHYFSSSVWRFVSRSPSAMSVEHLDQAKSHSP